MTFAAKVKTLKEDKRYFKETWTSEKHPNDFQMFYGIKRKR
jgi:hypothetical protein